MSVQFGRCSFDGGPADCRRLDQVRAILSPYGPDVEGSFKQDNVAIIYRGFHTKKKSASEKQPFISPSGVVTTWDGRLDNRSELLSELGSKLSADSADVVIVAAAYDRWGTKSFARLNGDWAASYWDPCNRILLLATDFVGTRHLYYSFDGQQACWATILEPLVLLAGKSFSINEEYIAGWLSFFPAAHLTPYVGIDAVPASTFVALRPGRRTVEKYWDFDPSKSIQYKDDRQYEEHFRHVFGTAVRRRLASDRAVLAELSGGMDSSSIVCVADTIIAGGAADTSGLYTLSYYDDSEPNWNERPFYTKVEQKRGQSGCHIDVSWQEPQAFDSDARTFPPTPASCGQITGVTQQVAEYVRSLGSRVLLSGTGGDEVTGGVPTPVPELMDLIQALRFRTLARELKLWALNKRKPWFHLLFEGVQAFFPRSFVGIPTYLRTAPWFSSDFIQRNRNALCGYPTRVKLLGARPSFQESLSTVEALRRQLSCSVLSPNPRLEKRYPYLDRDLLEFLFAVPRNQVVRPGERRSLMRRALREIVPSEVLNRSRKAFVARSQIVALSAQWNKLPREHESMALAGLGIVDPVKFGCAIEASRYDKEIPALQLMRAVGVEEWLRNLVRQGVLSGSS